MRLLSFAIGLAVTASVTGALAQSAGSTSTMTCNEARRMVSSQGAVVLNTGPDTFDRYVTSEKYCQVGQFVQPAFVPTADSQQCEIGFRCRTQE